MLMLRPPCPLPPAFPVPLADPTQSKMVQFAPRWFPRAAGCLLGLWAALASFQTATSQTSDLACPAEAVSCSANDVCGSCLETLQAGDIAFEFDFTECSELYADVRPPNTAIQL